MIINHNGKTIGINQEFVKTMSEKEFIRRHKNLGFNELELSSIYKQVTDKEGAIFDE